MMISTIHTRPSAPKMTMSSTIERLLPRCPAIPATLMLAVCLPMPAPAQVLPRA